MKINKQSKNYSVIMTALIMFFITMMSVTVMFSGCVFSAPEKFSPSEKVQFTTMQGLKTAHIFRIFALDSAKVYWDNGIMSEPTMKEIVIIADKFQKTINETSLALETYRKYEGVNSSDLETKIKLYQELYVQFNNLVIPYIIKKAN